MWFLKRTREAAADTVPVDPAAVQVLMVCMGNICRSPTAEAVLRTKLQSAGWGHRVAVDSAGTHPYHSTEPPDPRAVAHAARRGYDLTALRARPVRVTDFDRFHWMLAMDEANLRWLRQNGPARPGARLELLLEQAPQRGEREIPDPYYGAAAGFERVLDLVEAACDGFIERLFREGHLGEAPQR